MATRNITNTVVTTGGVGISGARIRVYLMPGPGFKKDTFAEVAPNDETITDSNGTWTFTLESNENISPDGTYYYVTEEIPDYYGGSREWSFRVLNSTAGTAQLSACLIVPPPNLPIPPTYLTQALGDARYSQIGGASAIWVAGGSYPFSDKIANQSVGGQLQAAWANSVRDHVVQVFDTTAERDTAITTPVAGMMCITTDTGILWLYSGGAWAPYIQGQFSMVSAAVGGVFAGTLTQLASMVIPTAPYQRKALIGAQVMEQSNVTTSMWQCNVKVNGVDLTIGRAYFGQTFQIGPRLYTLAPSTAYTVTVHGQVMLGAGTATVPSDPNFNLVSAIIFN